MSSVARRVLVRGRVQGVFFRDTCAREAQARGVTGWVGNAPDGTVAAHFEGEYDDVAAMVHWCRTGSTQAQVKAVEETETGLEGASDFSVR